MRLRLASWLGLLFLAACDHGHDHPHPHPNGKGDEEKTARITVWSDRFEIFLEHDFIVAGTATPFVTHVTDLKTLEPRKEGKVVFALRGPDGTVFEHAEDAPKRAGIYIPELPFSKAGEWAVGLRIPVDGREFPVELPKFTVYASKEDARKAPEPEAMEGIPFLKEQQWKVLTKAEPAGKRRLVERVRVPASVAARTGSRAVLTPPVAGRLLAPPGKALPSIGERVEAGQTLALVHPPFSDFAVRLVEANAEAIRAKLALDQATVALDRTKKLATSEARTARDVQEAEFALKSAQASYDASVALRAAYEKSGVVQIEGGVPALALKAPIGGVITAVSSTVGEHVPSEKAVLTILDASVVHLEARVPEPDAARFVSGKPALYELASARGKVQPIEGRLVHGGLEVDPATRTVSLLYEVRNADGRFKVGAALTLHLETARAEEAVAIPASALVEEDARPVAFVQVSGETFQKRPLKLGIRDGEWVQVLDGVSAGERVVTKEAYAIRLASVSSVIPAHGHSH
jgi:membrane fusion protein, heavy metal efflux system